jgi:hypothetical protein
MPTGSPRPKYALRASQAAQDLHTSSCESVLAIVGVQAHFTQIGAERERYYSDLAILELYQELAAFAVYGDTNIVMSVAELIFS